MNDDTELLRRFAEEGSEEAFAEFVRGRMNLVYAAALRQTGGDAHLAQDVTQGVFLALAQKARALKQHAVLTGWLYTTTRFLAVKAVRTQARWQRREQEANTMTTLHEAGPAWEDLKPVIDETMHELGETDRTALLLRFFEGRSLAEVGAMVGLAESSARMRVERALEKLRIRLARRGITSTAAAIGATLAAQPAVFAPAALPASVAAAAGVAANSGGGLVGLATSLLARAKVAAMAGSLAVGVAWYLTTTNRIEARVAAQEAQLDEAAAKLSVDQRRLQTTTNRTRENVPAPVPAVVRPAVDPLARMREVVNLVESGLVGRLTWKIVAVSSNLKAADLTELLVLTPDETVAMQRALDRTKEEIGTAAVARALTLRHGDQLIIELREFPEAAASYERLKASLRETLGAERYAGFEKLGCLAALEEMLGHLGLATYTNVLHHPAVPPRPNVTYLFERIKGVVEPTPPGRGVGSAVAGGDRSSLESNFGPLMALVPSDF